jgi:MOSC domain-containing protein
MTPASHPAVARIAELHVYPVKSARGIALENALLTRTGLALDRQWMIVGAGGRFITQRELPRLALLVPSLSESALQLQAPAMPAVTIPLAHQGERRSVTVWGHHCDAFDEGPMVQRWLQQLLQIDCALVRFDPSHRRLSPAEWTGPHEAHSQFADAFPLLALSTASLQDLNRRLDQPLPMNRFRPNIVLEGLAPYDEDRIDELSDGPVRLKRVKPCTRCKITTTDQDTGTVVGDEPLRTLRSYRYDAELHGVCFGQNLIILAGTGGHLTRGQSFNLSWQS